MDIKLTPQKVVKIGNSLCIRLGKKETEILNINEGDYLDISDSVPISKKDMDRYFDVQMKEDEGGGVEVHD